MSKKLLSLFLVMALMVSSLSGCASKYGEKKTTVTYYPGCYQPIAELRKSERTITDSTVSGTAIGAIGGALLGLLLTGKATGALTGAISGGLTGGITGNIYGRQQKEIDENRRMFKYLEDIDGDISDLGIVSASAKASLQCYDRQFKVLIRYIKAGKMSKEEAAKRYSEISSGREEAIALMGETIQQGEDLESQYQEAFEQEEEDLAVQEKATKKAIKKKAKTSSSTSTATNEARSRLNAAKQKKKTFSNKIQDLKRDKQDAEQASINNTRELEEAIADIKA